MKVAAGAPGVKRRPGPTWPSLANKVLFVILVGQALFLLHRFVPTLIELSFQILGLCLAVFNVSLKGTGFRLLAVLAAANLVLGAAHGALMPAQPNPAFAASPADPSRPPTGGRPMVGPDGPDEPFSVVTVPANAEVFIDDRPSAGEATWMLSHGRHTVRVTYPGYQDHAGTIEIPAQRAAVIALKPKPRF